MNETPQSNIEIRIWYKKEVESTLVLNEEWKTHGLEVCERAKLAWQVRHGARIKAREMMPDKVDVAIIEKRDLEKYGSKDGPSFDYLLKRFEDKYFDSNEICEEIIKLSAQTDKSVNNLLGL